VLSPGGAPDPWPQPRAGRAGTPASGAPDRPAAASLDRHIAPVGCTFQRPSHPQRLATVLAFGACHARQVEDAFHELATFGSAAADIREAPLSPNTFASLRSSSVERWSAGSDGTATADGSTTMNLAMIPGRMDQELFKGMPI
jgi:hypothetical protein